MCIRDSKATVAVYPEVKLGEYKGLTAEKEEVKVSADDVKERLNEMAERNARLEHQLQSIILECTGRAMPQL